MGGDCNRTTRLLVSLLSSTAATLVSGEADRAARATSGRRPGEALAPWRDPERDRAPDEARGIRPDEARGIPMD